MARDLIEAARVSAVEVISSPALQALRRITLGTVQWPGQRPRKYLSGGSTLTAEQRTSALAVKASITAALESASLPEAHGARLAIVAKMLLAFPAANQTYDSARARGEAYLDALDDVPPWALVDAVQAWNRGSGDGNHDFAPSPARLRELCLRALEPHRQALDHIEDLLNVWTLDDATDVSKQQQPQGGLIPKLRVMP